jgi:hypothetical protein
VALRLRAGGTPAADGLIVPSWYLRSRRQRTNLVVASAREADAALGRSRARCVGYMGGAIRLSRRHRYYTMTTVRSGSCNRARSKIGARCPPVEASWRRSLLVSEHQAMEVVAEAALPAHARCRGGTRVLVRRVRRCHMGAMLSAIRLVRWLSMPVAVARLCPTFHPSGWVRHDDLVANGNRHKLVHGRHGTSVALFSLSGGPVHSARLVRRPVSPRGANLDRARRSPKIAVVFDDATAPTHQAATVRCAVRIP